MFAYKIHIQGYSFCSRGLNLIERWFKFSYKKNFADQVVQFALQNWKFRTKVFSKQMAYVTK